MQTARHVNFKMLKAMLMALVAIVAMKLVEGNSICKAVNYGEKSALQPDVLDEFLFLADGVAEALMKEPADPVKPKPFYIDAYAVRTLGVAYDLTGRERYLAACRRWADKVIEHQSKMIPKGAYYTNYNRKPGESEGQWYVADCGSIGMGVLATAVRCTDEVDRKRYMDSATSFAKCVMNQENAFIKKSGGITDGYWNKYDKEWWNSTSLFAAFAFQLYGMTGDVAYEKVAMDAVDWLLRRDYNYQPQGAHPFKKQAPMILFYTLEAYACGLPYYRSDSERSKKIFARFSQAVEWIVQNQKDDGLWGYPEGSWHGAKQGGLPFHLLAYSQHVRDTTRKQRESITISGEMATFEHLVSLATDRTLSYLIGKERKQPVYTQRAVFNMMSYAEKLCPGEVYRKTKHKFPYKRYSEQEIAQLRQSQQQLMKK